MDDAVTALAARQDERAAFVATARTDDLSRPSRCDGWSVADVLRLVRRFA